MSIVGISRVSKQVSRRCAGSATHVAPVPRIAGSAEKSRDGWNEDSSDPGSKEKEKEYGTDGGGKRRRKKKKEEEDGKKRKRVELQYNKGYNSSIESRLCSMT